MFDVSFCCAFIHLRFFNHCLGGTRSEAFGGLEYPQIATYSKYRTMLTILTVSDLKHEIVIMFLYICISLLTELAIVYVSRIPLSSDTDR